jgi:hypothetical protein
MRRFVDGHVRGPVGLSLPRVRDGRGGGRVRRRRWRGRRRRPARTCRRRRWCARTPAVTSARAIAALPASVGAEIDTEQFAATAHQVYDSCATASERLGGLERAAGDAETAERLAASLAAEAALFDEISAAYAQGDVRRANRISRSEPLSDRVRELAEAPGCQPAPTSETAETTAARLVRSRRDARRGCPSPGARRRPRRLARAAVRRRHRLDGGGWIRTSDQPVMSGLL